MDEGKYGLFRKNVQKEAGKGAHIKRMRDLLSRLPKLVNGLRDKYWTISRKVEVFSES